MHQVTGATAGLAAGAVREDTVVRLDPGCRAGSGIRRNVSVDRERFVREMAHRNPVRRVHTGCGQWTGRRQIHVVLQQTGVAFAVLCDLGRARPVRVPQTVDPLAAYCAPLAVEIVEAVILFIDHNEVLVPTENRTMPPEPPVISWVGKCSRSHSESDRHGRACCENGPDHLSSSHISSTLPGLLGVSGRAKIIVFA